MSKPKPANRNLDETSKTTTVPQKSEKELSQRTYTRAAHRSTKETLHRLQFSQEYSQVQHEAEAEDHPGTETADAGWTRTRDLSHGSAARLQSATHTRWVMRAEGRYEDGRGFRPYTIVLFVILFRNPRTLLRLKLAGNVR
ncbi:hypothetical protein L596_013534 [Steinernema carpocapsae]|uniref:Uncharacterized protein n=1 Tax=Steinernema carpocapsae TaxID=34508 RepID=A0A4U5P0F7_STECR|nr:hypothetical protein L596_013534 [Steinernema carpocapsae]